MRPHVAVLDEEFGWPLSSGKRIRCWQLLSRLGRQYRITMLAHPNVDSAEMPAALEAFANAGIEPVAVHRRNPVKSGLKFALSLARNLPSRLPWSVANHASPEMLAALQRIAATDPPALVHCEWSPFARVAMRANVGVPWLINAQNVEYRIWERLADRRTNPIERAYLRLQASRFRRFERIAYRAASQVLAVSEEDAAIVRAEFGVEAEVVENGVDPDYFRPDASVRREPQRWLFLGSLDWLANRDAVDWLLDDILPLALRHIPDFELTIAGRKPPASMRDRIAGLPRVRLIADAPDIRPLLHAAAGLIVPLRIGGGSRLKILEALACRTPVISTTVGAEGLDLADGRHLTIADTPETLVDALSNAIADPAGSAARTLAGYERVLAGYDWKALSAKLGECWRTMIDENRRVGGLG